MAEEGFINCNQLYASFPEQQHPPQKLPVSRNPSNYMQLHRPIMIQNLRPLAPMPPRMLNEPDSVLKLFSEAADIHERQSLERSRAGQRKPKSIID